jgi:hypothetical protein
MNEKEKNMGIYDIMLLMNIAVTMSIQIYNEFKGENTEPMTKEQWMELQPTLVEMRKTAVKAATDI